MTFNETGSQVLVTFGIPAYDSPYFEQALRSALSQTAANLEVIVSDDGHRPETRAIVERLGDSRVRYFDAEGAPGVPANWNRCLRRASGTYFVLLPDDDVIDPEFIERMTGVLEAHPAAGFAQCETLSVDADLKVLDDTPARQPPASFLNGYDALAWQMETRRCNPAALMFRRDVLLRFGGWQEHYWDDWALTLRIAFRLGFAWVPHTLTMIRSHDTNLSRLTMRTGRDNTLDDINQQTAVFGEALPVTEDLLALRARWTRHLSHRAVIKAFRYALRGDLRTSLLHYRRARWLYPLAPLHPGFIAIALRNKLETVADFRRRSRRAHRGPAA